MNRTHPMDLAEKKLGKGVAAALPVLFTWEQAVIVDDPRSVACALTAAHRSDELGSKVFHFGLTGKPSSAIESSHNPLAEIRLDGADAIGDAHELAKSLTDPEGKGCNDLWSAAARCLLAAVILHCAHQSRSDLNRPVRFSDVIDFLTGRDPDRMRNLMDRMESMRDYRHTPAGPNPMVKSQAETMIRMNDGEAAGTASTAISYLTLYMDPGIQEATATSDWTIDDLTNAGQPPVTVYLTQNNHLEGGRRAPLNRLIMSQIERRLAEDSRQWGHRVLGVNDDGIRELTRIPDDWPNHRGAVQTKAA